MSDLDGVWYPSASTPNIAHIPTCDPTLDKEIGAFRDRDLSVLDYSYVFLDATYCKARVNHRVVSQAVVVAFGVALSMAGAKPPVSASVTARMRSSGQGPPAHHQ